jgi:predicted TIM-barrel fold metal-dependent hydrolase
MSAREIRSRLDHPVIDADGHTIEFMPALEPYLRDEGVDVKGPSFVRRESGSLGPVADWYALSPEDRARWRVSRGPWSGVASVNPVDEACNFLPSLLYQRLDDLGIDLSIVYPSFGLLFLHFVDEQDRRGACRALNRLNADLYREYSDRIIPVALIPMYTPEEAIDELDHAVGTLGHKAVVMAGFVQRPVAGVAEQYPDMAQWALWTDTYGLDSAYDYDPVWQRCRQLSISPTFHSGALGWQNRRSISSYVYNHVGMLGESHHALAKSLFLGGVTRRFPDLNFCFLEGGVAWGASLYADLIGHWEKRNVAAITARDPSTFDHKTFAGLFEQHGGPWASMAPAHTNFRVQDVDLLDEFAACGIERAEDIAELFVPRFYFGCEADDPMTSTAFNTRVNPFGARLHAMFGSDISHWDVPDMSEVLEETYEMVEQGLLTEDDYQDFMFGNPAAFYTHANPAFFKATSVEAAVDAYCARA